MANEKTLLFQMEQGQTLTSWLGSTSSALGTLKLQGLLNPNDFKKLECDALKVLTSIKNFGDNSTVAFEQSELSLLHHYASNVVEILASRRSNYYISSNFHLGTFLRSDLPSIKVHYHVYSPSNSSYILACPKDYDDTKSIGENILFLIPPSLFVSFFPNGCSLKFNNSQIVHPALKSFLNLRMPLYVTFASLNLLLSSSIESLYFPIRFVSLLPNDITPELLSFIMSILASRPGDTYQSILAKFFNIIHSYGMIEELKRNGNYVSPNGHLTSSLQQWNTLSQRFFATLNTNVQALPLNERSASLNLSFTTTQFLSVLQRFPFGAILVLLKTENGEDLKWLIHLGGDLSTSSKRTYLFTYDLNEKKIETGDIPNDLLGDYKDFLHHPMADQVAYIEMLVSEFDSDVGLENPDLMPASKMIFASNVLIREFNQALPDILPLDSQRIVLGDREMIVLTRPNQFLTNLLIQAGYRSALDIELPKRALFASEDIEIASVQSNQGPDLESISHQEDEIDKLSDQFTDLQNMFVNLGSHLQSLKLSQKRASKTNIPKAESNISSSTMMLDHQCELSRDDDFILTDLERRYGACNEIECACTSVSKVTVGGLIDLERTNYYCLQCRRTWEIKDVYRDLKLHGIHGKIVLTLTSGLVCDSNGWHYLKNNRENPIGKLPPLLIVPYDPKTSMELNEDQEDRLNKPDDDDNKGKKEYDGRKIKTKSQSSERLTTSAKSCDDVKKVIKAEKSSLSNDKEECNERKKKERRNSNSSIKSGGKNNYAKKRPDNSSERLLDQVLCGVTPTILKKIEKEEDNEENCTVEKEKNSNIKDVACKEEDEEEWQDVKVQSKKKQDSSIVWSMPSTKLGSQQHLLYNEFSKLNDEKKKIEWFLLRFLPTFVRFQSPQDCANLCSDLFDSTKYFAFGVLTDCLKEHCSCDVEKISYKVPEELIYEIDLKWIGICSGLDQPEGDYPLQVGYKYQTCSISAYTMELDSPLSELLKVCSRLNSSIHPDVIRSLCVVISAILQAGVLLSGSQLQGLYSYNLANGDAMPNVMLDLASGSLASFQ